MQHDHSHDEPLHDLLAHSEAPSTITTTTDNLPPTTDRNHMKLATFTATVEIEISAPADCSANQIGDLIDACVWDLGYEAPDVSVRQVLVLCDKDEILDDAPTSAQ